MRTDATSTASATLVSDPVPCQSGDGTLSLKYWTGGSTEIQICTMDAKTNLELKPCQTLDKSLSPGPARVLFKNSIHHPFKVIISFEFHNNDVPVRTTKLRYADKLEKGLVPFR